MWEACREVSGVPCVQLLLSAVAGVLTCGLG